MKLALPDAPPCVIRAQLLAAGLSARYYGLPVYLVGSAITDPDPRDIDLVIPIPDDLFAAMYGEENTTVERNVGDWCTGTGGHATPIWLRWARDCARQSRQLTMACRRAVDFKTQLPIRFDSYADKPRVRLDPGIMRDLPKVRNVERSGDSGDDVLS